MIARTAESPPVQASQALDAGLERAYHYFLRKGRGFSLVELFLTQIAAALLATAIYEVLDFAAVIDEQRARTEAAAAALRSALAGAVR